MNMISCSWTWFHVSEHEIMFQSMFMTQKHALCLRTWIMFRNMISCSWTWFHVSEHEIMFQNMFMTQKHALCLRTWNHVHEHDFMFMNMISCSWTWSSCSDLVRPEHDFVMFKHVLNMPKHVLNIEHVFSCSELWTWSEHGGHLVDGDNSFFYLLPLPPCRQVISRVWTGPAHVLL